MLKFLRNFTIQSHFKSQLHIKTYKTLCTQIDEAETKYKSLNEFDPEPEILKYYKYYINTEKSKNELEILYKEKNEYINKMNLSVSKGGFMQQKLSLFKGMLEYKRETQEILKIINENISNSEEASLQELSGYYFKHVGKMIRPYLMITISKYIYECIQSGVTNVSHSSLIDSKESYFDSEVHTKYIIPFAACVEVLHNASLLQDDIIDNSDQRRSYKTAHNIFGIRNTVFGSNYIISKASNVITDLNIPQLNEIYAGIVYYLTYGECQQSLRSYNLDNIDRSFQVYMLKTYYKTASLIALALRGIGIIYDLDESHQRDLFNLGLHIGLVFQLVDDVMDVLYDSSKMKKPALKDLQEGVINSHILFEIHDSNTNTNILEMAKRKFKDEEDINKVLKILQNGKGIIKTQNLSLDHLIDTYKILDKPFFINNQSKSNLLTCFQFLINRNY